MSIQPTQPQSIGGVLDTTFQLYKASVVKLIPLSLLAAVAASPPTIYMFVKGGGNLADPYAMLNMFGSPGYWLAFLASWIGSLWMMSTAYLKVGAIGAGSDLGLGAALQKALTRLPAILLMTILFSIALMLGFMLLIIPCFILMVSLALCFTTALFEDKGPVSALSESHRLVWGNWWRTTAILTVGFIVVLVIYLAVSLVLGVLTPLLVLGGGDAGTVLLITMISSLLLGVLVSLLVTPLYIALLLAIYWDLKLRKDGDDLAARVGALNPA
jgi:hypothetical protein